MYSEYVNSVINILQKDELNFKNNSSYNCILEHVSYGLGQKYFDIIITVLTEMKTVTFEDVIQFLLKNDKFGNPKKYTYKYNNKLFTCSPTSLRYVLHALLILNYDSKNKSIVEVGCGYGGLFLAINHFSKLLNIEINHYYFIDLPEIGSLIKKYIDLQSDIHINYSLHSSNDYGSDINESDLFFISNYCFTEIDEIHRNNYIQQLFPKVRNGFIVWQTIFNVPIQSVSMLNQKETIKEEYPQTSPDEKYKNYYVYF